MKRKSISVNYIYNMLYQVLVLITPLITTPYLSRVLGATGIGIFSYVQSIAAYFVLFGTVGSSLYGQREIAYVQEDKKKRTTIFIEISFLRFITSIVSMVVFYFSFVCQSEHSVIYKILILEILANMVDITWYFQGMEDFSKVFYRNLLIKILGISMIFLFVKTKADLPLYTICYVLPLLVGNLTLWPTAIKSLVKVQKISLVQHIKPLLIFFIPQIATEVYTVLDKTMIGVLSTSIDEVGFYTQAQKLVKMTLCIVSSLGTVMLSAMSREFQRNNIKGIIDSVMKSYRFVYFTGMPLMFGIIGVSNNFCPWFFGPGFESVSFILMLQAPIIVIIGMSNVTGRQFLLPTKKQSKFTASVFLGAIVNFGLNLIFIPKYNALGAVIATIIAESCVTIIQLFFVRKDIHAFWLLKEAKEYFFTGLIMCVVVFLIGNVLPSSLLTFIVQVIVGGCLYFVILILKKDEMLHKAINVFKTKILKMK